MPPLTIGSLARRWPNSRHMMIIASSGGWPCCRTARASSVTSLCWAAMTAAASSSFDRNRPSISMTVAPARRATSFRSVRVYPRSPNTSAAASTRAAACARQHQWLHGPPALASPLGQAPDASRAVLDIDRQGHLNVGRPDRLIQQVVDRGLPFQFHDATLLHKPTLGAGGAAEPKTRNAPSESRET